MTSANKILLFPILSADIQLDPEMVYVTENSFFCCEIILDWQGALRGHFLPRLETFFLTNNRRWILCFHCPYLRVL